MNINDFKNNLKAGGVRPNLFRVNGPIGPSGADSSGSFLIRTASLPATNLSTIMVPFRGRQIKLPGNRTFDDRQNNAIKTYSFFHCFPTVISDMALDADASDTLSDFTVTMSYSYFLTSDAPDVSLTESVDVGGVGEAG